MRTRTWAVRYFPPEGETDVWFVVTGAPSKTPRRDVLAALGVWSRWPAMQARVAPGGRIAVTRYDGPDTDAGTVVEEVRWGDLTPDERTITVRVPGGIYAEVSRACRAGETTITAWILAAIDERLAS